MWPFGTVLSAFAGSRRMNATGAALAEQPASHTRYSTARKGGLQTITPADSGAAQGLQGGGTYGGGGRGEGSSESRTSAAGWVASVPCTPRPATASQ
jgi:hypothetical protein